MGHKTYHMNINGIGEPVFLTKTVKEFIGWQFKCHKCGEMFIRNYPGSQWCSPKCRETGKKRRQRRRRNE